jgi:diaminopimelate epimerase
MKIHFIKMHGLGNDFILIDCIAQSCPTEKKDLAALGKRLCERRFGIGADQILLLFPSQKADFMMRIFNADGSEVEMCGNGIRCLAQYIWDSKLSDKKVLSVETLAGIIRPEKAGDLVEVDMGEPIFEPARIPVALPQPSTFILHPSGAVVDYPLKIEDREFAITCVSMGNPHAIILVDDVLHFPVTYYGPIIENHLLFPQRINVEFIEVLSETEIRMRVWERGAGETMACGTGASAAAVATSLKGKTGRKVTVHLLGGDLSIEWAGDNHVSMTGPAARVFEGVFDY